MASLTDVTAPGAYPTTPQAEEPASQTQSGETHQREYPYGRGGGLEQEMHPSGHNFAGSGIYVDDSSLSHGADDTTSSSYRNPFQQTSRIQEIPRSLGTDAQPSGHQFSADYADDSSLTRAGESDSSGLMTGAYSRVGTRDSSFAPIGNYTHDKTSPSDSTHDSTHDVNSRLHADTGRVGGTVKNTDFTSPTSPTGMTTDGDAEHRSDSRRQSNAKHEPYWGDIPFGTGVYNGVTGHGSKEPVAHQGSLHDEYGTAGDRGVYNGVTGHGSKESKTTTPAISDARSRDTTTTNVRESSQQRKFPLVGGAGSTTATTTSDSSTKHGHGSEKASGSHAKEVLAGAGATGAAGYAAHEFFGRDRGTDGTLASEKSVSEQGGLAGAQAQHHGRKDRGVASIGEGKRGLADSTVAAAPVARQADYQTSERHADNRTANEKNQHEHSRLGYLGAAAAMGGVGAGAYGAHEYAARDTAQENESARGGSEVLMAAPSSTTRELAQRDTQLMNDDALGSNHKLERQQPRSNMLSGSDHKQTDNLYPSGSSHDKTQSNNGGRSHAMPGDDRATAGNVIADPTYGGRYNVLSSGTPSGIDLDQSHSSTKSGH
ncbi:hypothetical protein F5X97DRAFT_300490 [Nemania serpens]|nr:hypothetical protein F5X97DRAFT_300490 [Nemania serpens]